MQLDGQQPDCILFFPYNIQSTLCSASLFLNVTSSTYLQLCINPHTGR